jgi:PleD family two-component response regulator
MSFGVAAVPAYDGGISQLFAQADTALFEAKRAGRNRVVDYGEVPLAA